MSIRGVCGNCHHSVSNRFNGSGLFCELNPPQVYFDRHYGPRSFQPEVTAAQTSCSHFTPKE